MGDSYGNALAESIIGLGPNATFDFALDGDFPDGITYTGVAYYDGSFEHGKSSSDRAEARWTLAG